MCGRFTLTETDLAALARAWAAEVDAALAAGWKPRFNVAPGESHPVLVERGGVRRLVPATFGLAGPGTPGGAGRLLVNARLEGAAEKPAFRDAWKGARAAVPADGFFEWEGPPKDRRPTWFHRPDGRPFLLAALLGEAPGGGPGFAILTTESAGPVARLHDRMPVLVAPARVTDWLAGPPPPPGGGAEAGGPLDPAGGGALAGRGVSRRVNAAGTDGPDLLEPAGPDPQGRLF